MERRNRWDSTAASYSGGTVFKSRKILLNFPQPFQENIGMVPQIIPRYFAIHYSLIILRFDGA